MPGLSDFAGLSDLDGDTIVNKKVGWVCGLCRSRLDGRERYEGNRNKKKTTYSSRQLFLALVVQRLRVSILRISSTVR